MSIFKIQFIRAHLILVIQFLRLSAWDISDFHPTKCLHRSLYNMMVVSLSILIAPFSYANILSAHTDVTSRKILIQIRKTSLSIRTHIHKHTHTNTFSKEMAALSIFSLLIKINGCESTQHSPLHNQSSVYSMMNKCHIH